MGTVKLDLANATARPWRVRIGPGTNPPFVIQSDAGRIASIDGVLQSEEAVANAYLITDAVNSYGAFEAMREALVECKSTLSEIADACDVKVTGTPSNTADIALNLAISFDKAKRAIREVDVALKLAKGGE